MKPSIERELQALRDKIADLEARLKKPEEALGHRVIFDQRRSGEVPASPGGNTKFLREDRQWVVPAGGGSLTGAQTFSYFATGAEDFQFTVTLPVPYDDTSYQIYMTNAGSTGSVVYQIPANMKTSTNFVVLSTAQPDAGDRLDFFTMSV